MKTNFDTVQIFKSRNGKSINQNLDWNKYQIRVRVVYENIP